MTIIEKLDAVLECLYKISGDNPDFNKIEIWLTENKKVVHTGEIQDCLLYLHNERYIYCEYMGDRTAGYIDSPNAHYLINVNGKYLYETIGGFVKKTENENDEKALIKTIQIRQKEIAQLVWYATLAIAVGTLIAALYYLDQLCGKYQWCSFCK